MEDLNSILISNFSEALKQLNTYLSIGLTAALSALVIEWQSAPHKDEVAMWLAKGAKGPAPTESEQSKQVKLPFVVPELNAEHAKWLLIATTMVAGLLAYMAILAANSAATELQSEPEVMSAICTYPSLATMPKFVPEFASLSPAVLAGVVMWLNGRRLHIMLGQQASGAKYTLLAPLVVVYGALALQLHDLPC